MSRVLLLLAVVLMAITTNAQTATNIRAVQDGEKINIHFQIPSSSSEQLFRVSINCKVNNSEPINLVHLTGDAGDNVEGGRNSYMAVWDIMADVAYLKSAEFSITVQEKNNGALLHPIVEIGKKKRVHTYRDATMHMALAQVNYYTPVGLRLCYTKKWGAYVSLAGGRKYNWNRTEYYGNYQNSESTGYLNYTSFYEYDDGQYELQFTATTGITKRLINTRNISLHTYLGAGYAYWGYAHKYTEYKTSGAITDTWNGDIFEYERYAEVAEYVPSALELEFGLIGTYRRIALSAGLDYSYADNPFVGFTFGLGYVFNHSEK